ncbi:MAG: hypothetical protein ACLFP6_12940 [Spirochaetaceae bacterium]
MKGLSKAALVMLAVSLLLAGCDNPAGTDQDNGADPATTGPVISVSLEGTKLSDQDSVDFDQLNSSRTNTSETITLTNSGDEDLTLSKVEIGGINGENTTSPSGQGTFHWASSPDTTPLPPGESRGYTIEISYTGGPDPTFSGTLTIESDTVGTGVSPFVLNLSGEYISTPGGSP